MNRARLIVKDVVVQRQGEIKYFQIRFPQNTKRIIGVETDAFILSQFSVANNSQPASSQNQGPVLDDGTVQQTVDRTPFLKWNPTINPTLGKLKLQNFDRSGIFFETWISFILFAAGIPDMSFGMFGKSPYLLNTNGTPKKQDLQCPHLLVEGMYEDGFGVAQNKDMNYIVKVFLWVETEENNKGIVYDFQNTDTQNEKELEIKI